MVVKSLTTLKIRVLHKQYCERPDHGGYQPQPAELEVEVVLHEDFHGDAIAHRCHDIAKLRDDQLVFSVCIYLLV